MMLQNTEIRILKKFALTTERGEKSRIALKRTPKLPVYGVPKTTEESALTAPWQEPYAAATWFDSRAYVAAKQSLLLIMKTMTSLLMLCGSANHATSSVTKSC